MMSDHDLISSFEGDKERRMGKTRGAFSGMHRALNGWMLARAQAPPAQGLHHHGPRYFNFLISTMCGLEKPGFVDQNWLERNLSSLLLRALLVVGRRQQSESIEVALENME